MNQFSAVILTKNSNRYLPQVLESLKPLNEVVIVDNGSIDNTLEIARSFSNTTIVEHEFIGFGPLKRKGSEFARNDWIFSIDSDEVLTKEALEEMMALELNSELGYSFAYHNIYNGKHITCCGWHPDRQVVIYDRRVANFDDSQVHEKIVRLDGAELKEVELKSHVLHYPYSGASDFLKKMDHYSTLFANQNKNKKSSSPIKAFTHAFWAFFKNYFLQKGFLDGYEGFLISCYNSQTAFWKYIKLYELNTKQ